MNFPSFNEATLTRLLPNSNDMVYECCSVKLLVI
jgi:hypothetical protein